MKAETVKKLLGLVPHPREGGWYTRTYEAEWKAEGGVRVAATAIYYLLEADSFSEMHRLTSDEMFHFYAGDPVQQLQLWPGGNGRMVTIGNDLGRGDRPQSQVPGGVWQGARLLEGGEWALLGCTVTPGFELEDYESGNADELSKGWPEWAEVIRALCLR